MKGDKQLFLMSHGRMYPYMASGSGAPPLFLTYELSTYMRAPDLEVCKSSGNSGEGEEGQVPPVLP